MINISNKKHIPVLCLMFFVFCSFCLGSVSYSTPVSAYSASLTTDSSVELNVSHLGNGTDVEAKSIRVVSDCRAGYNLSIATTQNNSLYLNGDGTSSASFTGVDGTSALNSSNNTNKWGYTLTNNATSSSVFSPLSTTESILKTPTQTASPSSDIDDTFPIYYGVKVNDTVTPGTYQMASNGEIVYYLTMEASCIAYTVNFNANGGTGSVATQNITAGEPTKLTSADTLVAPTGSSYTDAGNNTITGQSGKLWVFWGWNTAIDGSGDWYKDREEVTDLTTGGSTITLYAQWKQATLADLIPGTPTGSEKVIDHNLMQDMRAEVCWNSEKTTAANAPAATLLDYRGKVTTGSSPESAEQYTVSKLADGLCWMTKNLNLGRSDGTVTLTSEDTDLADNTTFTLPASANTSSTNNTLARIRNTNTNGTNDNGTYYSWAAAVANTTSTSTNPNTSICPKNWDLPSNDQYLNLENKANYSSTNQPTAAPSTFLASGGFTNGASFYSTNGCLWTNTSSSTAAAYGARITANLITTSATTDTSIGGDKYYEKNIRCVANMDKASYTITYINTDGGATQTQKIVMNESYPLQPTTTWTRTNYKLMGWDTNSSGTNVVYTTGQEITPSSNMTLYTVWKPAYTIQYNGNGAGAGVMTSLNHTNVVGGDEITLYPSNFSKSGYGFAGWSFDQNPTSSSVVYGPNETIVAPASSTPGETKTLYAVWVASSGDLQSWTGCSSMSAAVYNNGGDSDEETWSITANLNNIIALTDTRDNDTYAIAKLTDGNCWMIENLRIDDSAILTIANTNNPLNDGTTVTLKHDYSDTTTYNTLSPTSSSATSWCINDSSACNDQSRLRTDNTANRATNPTASSTNIYSYGNYYNWYSATAGRGTYSKTSGNTEGDLCPAGWRLPTGTGSGEFGLLSNSLGGYKNANNEAQYMSASTIPTGTIMAQRLRHFPNNLLFSGYSSGGSIAERASAGLYWTSTAQNSSNFSFALIFKSSTITPGTNPGNKYIGRTLRCISYNLHTITLNGNGANNTPTSSTTVAHDATTLNNIATLPTKSSTTNTRTVSGWTTPSGNNASGATVNGGTTPGTLNSTATTTYTFNGWHMNSGTGTLIAGTGNTPTLTSATTTYTSGGKWTYNGDATLYAGWDESTGSYSSITLPTITKTGYDCGWTTISTGATTSSTPFYQSGAALTPSSATTTLYGVCSVNSYSITLDKNGATNSPTTSTTVSYNATTLGALATLPTKSSYTISGFTTPAGNNASGATVSSTTSLVATNTFNGWHIDSGTGTLVASNASTPALQANVSGYTDSGNRWTRTSTSTTLYAGWTTQSKTLPTITKAGGFTCGWTTTSTGATDFTYASGASLVPSANTTLYGVCTCPANRICYDQNASSGVEGTMSWNNINASDTSANLSASNYSRSGYGFAGWGTNSDGTGTNYGPQETISFTAGQYSTTGLILYANWIQSSGDLQNWNGCNSMTAATYNNGTITASLSNLIALTDTRDNQVYTIAKLTDGKCWMIENLRLDNTATLTIANTNNPLNDGTTVTLKHDYSDTQTYNTLSTSSDSSSWCNTNSAECTDQSRLNIRTSINYSYGNYYNWYSATAGNGTFSKTSGKADGDICPAGWRLPTGSGSGEFGLLSNSLGGYQNNGVAQQMTSSTTPSAATMYQRIKHFPNNFISASGAVGTYWTSSVYGSTPYRTYFHSTTFMPATNGINKFSGYNVRCIAGRNRFAVTLNGNGATNTPTTSTNVFLNDTTLGTVATLPAKSNSTSTRTVSGWTTPSGNNASGATVNGGTTPGTLNSTATTTYTFNGWHKDSGTGTLIASNASTPALQASTTYTDANSKWTYENDVTLYAGWDESTGSYSSITLPTITKTGYDCGWTTISSGATTSSTPFYQSGAALTPSSATTTLYGVCSIKTNLSLKVSFNSTYVSSIKVCKTSGNCSGTDLMGTVTTSGNSVSGLTYNTAYYLYPVYNTGFTIERWFNNGPVGTLSSTTATNPTFTIGDGNNYVTHTGKGRSYNFTLNRNCPTTATGSTSITATYYSTSLSTITVPTCANATGTRTVSGWTTPAGNNADGAIVNGGTAPGTLNSTNTTTYTYTGLYTDSSASTLVASSGSTPTLQANVSGYTDSSNRWIRTSGTMILYAGWNASAGSYSAVTLPTITKTGYDCGWTTTSTGATSIAYQPGASFTPSVNTTLYGVCVVNSYTITLDGNGADNNYTTSTTVSYGASSLGTIATLPSITSTTSSRTVSGFIKSSGNHAEGATISSTTQLTSTVTTNYSFDGWMQCASTTCDTVADYRSTPNLFPNTDYTDTEGNWNYDGNAILYAEFYGYTNVSSVTLPTITKTGGFTCGWTTTSTGATSITYASGASLTPSNNTTLYGVCTCPANKICYDQNAASGVEGTMGGQTITSSATSAMLIASNYSRSGYGFAGWGTNSNGTGSNYGPQETISFTAGQYSATGLTLYANWIESSGNLQDWSGCGTMTAATYNDGTISASLSNLIALTDTRDNQTYAIAKLPDGECWMIENLRLDNTASLTTSNTNNPLNNGSTVTLKHNYSDTTTYNTLSATSSDSTSWCTTSSAECDDQSRVNTNNTSSRASNPTSNDTSIYSYGNYYNWYSATAGRGTYGKTGNTIGDLCPAGWHMPTGRLASGDNNGEYGQLTNSLGGYIGGNNRAQSMTSSTTPTSIDMRRRLETFPINYLSSGYLNAGSINSRGTSAIYWNSTGYNAGTARAFQISDSNVHPGNVNASKYYGRTVRCIAGPTTLYNTVASMSNGTVDYDPDFYFDGVNEYSGNDSDGTKQDGTKAKIYIYYGELDSTTPTYGSAGNAETFPNYVILSAANDKSELATTDTCWRIIRTTGSGGVKMIYNGKWTGSTCARATTNAQYGSYTYNGSTAVHARQAVRVGFTHNATYASESATSAVNVNTLYGSSSNYSGNTSNSTANNRVKDFYDANLTAYTSIFEPNAGYCNDRSSYTSTAGTTATSSFIPYIAANGTATGNTRLAYYGGYVRNLYSSGIPSLNCPRGNVDIYSTDATVGGNGQLRVPAALITADEVKLAGAGWDDGAQSNYLVTGSDFWTMTPHSRQTRLAYEIYVNTDGGMVKGTGEVNNSKGIRPVVSLIEGIKATSGDGIATNPWIVNLPSGNYTVRYNANGGSGSMEEQSIDSSTATNLTSNTFTSPSANYVFGGWNTKKNGSGTSYTNAQSVTGIAGAGQTITLYAQWDCLGGYVCYDDNGANSETTMSKQTIGSSDTSVTFWASNFQRPGYGFAGWNTRADGTGTNYGPNYTLSITAGQHASKGIKLYAKWVEPAKDSNNNILTFQTTSLLSTTLKDGTTLASKSNGYVTALKDQRDDEVYAVAKLADGNYWMIENMRILDDNTLGDTNKALAQAYQNSSVYGNFIGLPSSTTYNFSQTAAANSLYAPQNMGDDRIIIGTTNEPPARIPRYNNSNVTNPTSNMTAAYDGSANVYSIGNYYNWPAAMANTSYYTTETKNTSICPKNWRIPYGGTGTDTGGGNTSGGIYYLAVALGATADNATSANIWRSYPNNFVQSGTFEVNTVTNPTSIVQQTSTSKDITNAYMFSSAPTASKPGNFGPKWVGRPMRCVIISN